MSDFENKFESILVPFLSLLESNGADIDPYFYVPNQWNSEQKRERERWTRSDLYWLYMYT